MATDRAALDYIEEMVKVAGESTADGMLNRQVEVYPERATKYGDLPRSE